MWILVGIIVLGLMVLVHEWGHFVVAKLLGVRVNVFSIGFGPRLFGLRRGPTDYRLSALPLGGYVSMAGDNPTEERAGAPDEFLSKPRWQRALIAVAGPAMNILAAVLVLAGLFYYHYERPAILDEPARVAAVLPDSPAARVGLQSGDHVVRFHEAQNPTWQELLIESALTSNKTVELQVQRGSELISLALPVPEQAQQDPWAVGWLPEVFPAVQRVQEGSPAAEAGLQSGDLILALNGEPVRISLAGDSPLSQRLQEIGGQPVTLTIEREGEKRKLTATPVYSDHPEGERWILGFLYAPRPRMVRKDLSPWQALRTSLQTNVEMSGQMLDLVKRLFTGGVSLSSVQGPVGIVHFSGEMGERGGLLAILNLTALISLSLGILNLLPIPILDGGHLAVLAIEGGMRRDLSLRVKERLVQAGLAFILMVFAIVMYNDIARIVTN